MKISRKFYKPMIVILSFTLLLVSFLLTVSADEGGDLGGSLTWFFEDDTSTLTISGNGPMPDWEAVTVSLEERPWHTFKNSILHIVVTDGVTTIGDAAFSECLNVTSVSIPDTITSIGENAFFSNLFTTIKFPDNPNFTYIGDTSFASTALISVDIPDSVEYIGGAAFENCRGLASVKLPINPNFTVLNAGTFQQCLTLKTIEIPASVKVISTTVFQGASQLESVIFVDNSNLIVIERYAFSRCLSLKNIIIPVGVTVIRDHAFSYCTSLEEIEIPANVTSIETGAFMGCTSLSGVTFAEGSKLTSIGGGMSTFWSGPNIYINGGAFEGCMKLEKIEIPVSVTSIGLNAFNGCIKLEEIEFFKRIPPTLVGTDVFKDVPTTTIVYVPHDTEMIYGEVPALYGFTIAGRSVPPPCKDRTCGTCYEPKPTIAINYVNETLIGFDSEGIYTINGTGITEMVYPIPSVWLGTTLDIVRKGNGLTTLDSEIQSLSIPIRPVMPSIKGENETIDGFNDGRITGTTAAMEYRLSTDTIWINAMNGETTGLSPGDYQVRIKATSTNFASLISNVTISTGDAQTHTLNITVPMFESVEVGYVRPGAKAIVMSNSGNSDIAILNVTISPNSAFTIGGYGRVVPSGGSINTWTIQPNSNLPVGEYNAVITVEYNYGAIVTENASFTVKMSEYPSQYPPIFHNIYRHLINLLQVRQI